MKRRRLGGLLIPLLLHPEEIRVPGELQVGERHRLALESIFVALDGPLETGDAASDAGLDERGIELSSHLAEGRLRREAGASRLGRGHRHGGERGVRRQHRHVVAIPFVEVLQAVQARLDLPAFLQRLCVLIRALAC